MPLPKKKKVIPVGANPKRASASGGSKVRLDPSAVQGVATDVRQALPKGKMRGLMNP